jgi:hypothetical protein
MHADPVPNPEGDSYAAPYYPVEPLIYKEIPQLSLCSLPHYQGLP